jgi:hypothetical protein
MKALFKTALIIAAITSAIHAQEGQLRLAPSEINALATVNAGAGTSGVWARFVLALTRSVPALLDRT